MRAICELIAWTWRRASNAGAMHPVVFDICPPESKVAPFLRKRMAATLAFES
jgi:hypothetical protein